ncbi:MAG: RluA family pseudouridine synthase [Patescibacteria group bacterium]
MKYKVSEQFNKWRLDKFLNETLPEVTRSQIQKKIQSGLVLVNGKKPAVHQFLKTGDNVEFKEEKVKKAISKVKKVFQKDMSKELFKKIEIIDDKDDYLIINKPADLLVHPTESSQEKTLVDWLMKKFPKLKNIGDDPSRPAIVHRLDKETSGLMIIPKTQAAFHYFKKQFQDRLIAKKYYALIYGKLDTKEDSIAFRIGRSSNKGAMAAHPFNSDLGREALTQYEVIKEYNKYSLLDVSPKTGRTHQIRVHLFALSHPVVGDPLYKSKQYKPADIGRMFLESYYLKFTDLQGNEMEYEIDLKEELNNFLRKL